MTGGAQDGGVVKWEFDPLDGSIFFRPDPLTKYVVAELQSSDDSYGHMIVDAVNSTRATPAPAGWQDISSAPYNTPVEIQVGRMTMWARLIPNGSEDENGSCDQWQAEYEGEHPPCWSGGACWASNEDEIESIQPTAWLKRTGESPTFPTAPAEGGV